jgi:hypothetical protein
MRAREVVNYALGASTCVVRRVRAGLSLLQDPQHSPKEPIMKAIRILVAAAALALTASACSRSITAPDARPAHPSHDMAPTFGGGVG